MTLKSPSNKGRSKTEDMSSYDATVSSAAAVPSVAPEITEPPNVRETPPATPLSSPEPGISDSPEFKTIGSSPIRRDAYDKVTGRAAYTGDVRLPGMVWGDILRSPYAHARIRSIDTSVAGSMAGVLAVVTYADLPPVTTDPIDMASDLVPADRARANLFASDRVMYVGHPVAAVAAVDRNTARLALDKIIVEYEPLPAVLDVDSATADGAPLLHPDLEADHLGELVEKTNITWWFRYEFGDPDKAFADASLIIDREFTYSTVHQGYIEPQTAIALWREDDQIELWASTQGGFGARKQTAGLLGQPDSGVTVHPTEIGGGFGGKTTVYLTPFAALLSKKIRRPVKMVMDRKTVFEATGPTPAGKIRVKMGVNDDGRIVVAESTIRFEAGAFPGWVPETASKSMFTCYNIPNTRVDGLDILVNKPRVNSYRGPGAPQVTFATESIVDEICERMGWDRFDFRLANASKEGSRRSDGPRLGKVGNREALQAARSSSHWQSPYPSSPSGGKLYGRGVATAFVLFSGRESTVSLGLNPDGTVNLMTGSTDMSGARAAIAMQAAEALGIPVDDVNPSVAGTSSIGSAEVSHGSRTTYATGWAAVEAAGKLIDILRERVAENWNSQPASVTYSDGEFVVEGDSSTRKTFRLAATEAAATGAPVAVVASVDPPSPAQGVFATHIVDISLDPSTGKVDILRYTTAQDAGRAIHSSQVEGQMHGAVAQGIGFALHEGFVYSDDGHIENSTLQDYRIPTSIDLPFIETVIVEVPNPTHPYGVRGVGEVSIAPPAAAIANAIADATGTRIRALPMRATRVLASLRR